MKPEIEFTDVQSGFEWVHNEAKKFNEQILAKDPDTGDLTKMVSFPPSYEQFTDYQTHVFWEEVLILNGAMYDKGLKKWFRAGSYACRPPGMIHGPYKSCEFEGCKFLCIIRYPEGTSAPK